MLFRSASGTVKVSSPAFEPGGRIPKKHAYFGEGENVSPPLAWSGAPGKTNELAVIVDDPDAPGEVPWVHWVLYKIPESTPASRQLTDLLLQSA